MLNIPEEIKDLLHEDTCKKNIRIHFPNGERTDICNDLIVRDSVTFTESLCSQDTLKFGLCEAPVFECEAVGVGNIKGATIEVYNEVFCDMSVSGAVFRPDLLAHVYPIPYGTFIVDSCDRQADIIHRRIVAYNNLKVSLDSLNNNGRARLQYLASDATAFSQNLAAFLTETLQENVFSGLLNPLETELGEGSRGYGTVGGEGVFKYVQYKITAANANNLYYIKVNDPDYDMSNAEYVRVFTGWTSGLTSDRCFNFSSDPYSLTGKVQRALGYSNPNPSGSFLYPFMSLNANDTNAFFTSEDGVYIRVLYEIVYDIRGDIETIHLVDPDKIKIYTVGLPDSFTHSWVRTLSTVNKYNVADATQIDLREQLSGYVELFGMFCGVNRYGNAFVLNIKRQFNLLPSSNLKPGTNVYPLSAKGGKLLPEDYQTCWYDDEYTKPFGAIYVEYDTASSGRYNLTYYFPGYNEYSDPDTYLVYDLTSNDIIRDNKWTENDINNICQRIMNNLVNVSYMPVDFVGRGLPYVEAGDTFEILTKLNESITTIVLNRTLTGEQVLTDNYKSV